MLSVPQLWTPEDFAHYASLTPDQVAYLRRSGKGPAYTKLGRAVRYVPGVVHRWVIDNQQNTTEDTP